MEGAEPEPGADCPAVKMGVAAEALVRQHQPPLPLEGAVGGQLHRVAQQGHGADGGVVVAAGPVEGGLLALVALGGAARVRQGQGVKGPALSGQQNRLPVHPAAGLYRLLQRGEVGGEGAAAAAVCHRRKGADQLGVVLVVDQQQGQLVGLGEVPGGEPELPLPAAAACVAGGAGGDALLRPAGQGQEVRQGGHVGLRWESGSAGLAPGPAEEGPVLEVDGEITA